MANKLLLKAQRNEITEHEIYKNLARYAKGKNKEVLKHIANDEMKHYKIIKKITKKEVKPKKWRIYLYSCIARIFGLTFGLRLMERGEHYAQQAYRMTKHKKAAQLLKEEQKHEQEILAMLKDKRLEYAGNFVLGLNDALIELTGALTGFTITLQNPNLIAATGFITGFAGSLSMAASGYLQSREEKAKEPIVGGFFTGIAYFATTLLLIAPFIIMEQPYNALIATIITAVIVVMGYTFYISVAKRLSFKKRFFEMAALSGSVIIISLIVGWFIRAYLGVEA